MKFNVLRLVVLVIEGKVGLVCGLLKDRISPSIKQNLFNRLHTKHDLDKSLKMIKLPIMNLQGEKRIKEHTFIRSS